MKQSFTIEVVYPLPKEQKIFFAEMQLGQTIQQAIEQSGILQHYPEIDLSQNAIGVFGKRKALSDEIKPQDRIEIYRPLEIDPKQARLIRAKKKDNTAK